MTGKIVDVVESRGYGFVRVQGSMRQDYFFHCSALVGMRLSQSLVGKPVEFEVAEVNGRERATSVREVQA